MTNVLLEIFFVNRDTSVALAMHSFSLSLFHHLMSLNIDMKINRPWNCSGSHIFFVHELLDFLDELQCGKSWEIVHSNSIGSPSIVSNVLSCNESSKPSQLSLPNSI